MLNSKEKFGFMGNYKILFSDTSDTVDSAIVKGAVECYNDHTCFIWAAKYHNISTILNDWNLGIYRGEKNWTDEKDRPLLCELEVGAVRTFDLSIIVRKRSPFFESINDVISHIVEGGIVTHIKKRGYEKAKFETKYNFRFSGNKYLVFGVGQLQTPFYLLTLGYTLSVVCFLTEIAWHRYRSKGRERTYTSLCHRQT